MKKLTSELTRETRRRQLRRAWHAAGIAEKPWHLLPAETRSWLEYGQGCPSFLVALALNTPRPWRQAEMACLYKAHVDGRPFAEVARLLGRTVAECEAKWHDPSGWQRVLGFRTSRE